MEKILTIVVPSYNTEIYIDEVMPHYLLEEILPFIEILFVNDGSTDHTKEKLESYEKQYPNTIRVIHKENGGHGSAINTGIMYAKGTYFKVIDGDDWVDTDALMALVNFLRELEEEVDLIYSPYIIQYVNKNESRRVTYTDIFSDGIYDIKEIFERKFGLRMHGITYKTNILQENNIRLDEKLFYVDQEYILYPLKYVKKILFYNAPVYQYRMGTQEQSMNMTNMIKRRDMHKKVIDSLIQYFVNIGNEQVELRKYLDFRIAGLVNVQLGIYLLGEPKGQMYKELLSFLEEVNYSQFKHKAGMCKLLFLLKFGYPGFVFMGLLKRIKNMREL